ncbi:uncharacterized protein Hap1MRO34_002094 [Clarias gariepinus]|uniref:uncharacterized protein LOC128515985 n=1 Tax=Clarias gariepinus TaxID=13013 RepID=UPI00234DC0E5|nr:uncharacterized protein LOC128515985 [Clarias gariepinus]
MDISKLFHNHRCFPFRRNRAPEDVLKNTAKAVIVPLRDGFSSLNRVYEGLMGDVDPVTGQSFNYDYIREQIVQAHQHLQMSEQVVSSGLESLDESLERLVQNEGKLEQKMKTTQETLESLRLKQESKEKLLIDSQGALALARENLNSSKQTLEEQEARKYNAEVITGVGAGLMLIPVIGWIAGPAMMIGGAIELSHAKQAVEEAEEENDEKLKQTRERIQKVKQQIGDVGDFQMKVRSAVRLLSVLSGRASVAEHQTRRFIIQEPVLKVMEDVMKATNEITGNDLLYNKDMSRLISQMSENNQRLAAICDSEEQPEEQIMTNIYS